MSSSVFPTPAERLTDALCLALSLSRAPLYEVGFGGWGQVGHSFWGEPHTRGEGGSFWFVLCVAAGVYIRNTHPGVYTGHAIRQECLHWPGCTPQNRPPSLGKGTWKRQDKMGQESVVAPLFREPWLHSATREHWHLQRLLNS